MLKNYIIVTIRHLFKYKIYTLMNVSGLAIGMASFILMLCFVQHELSYDRFYPNSDRIYRVIRETRSTGADQAHYEANTSGALADALMRDFPEVQRATRMGRHEIMLRYKDKFFQQKFDLVDASFFDIFQIPFLKGNPQTALQEPYTIVLTEKMARKYFGDENPMGKILTVDGRFWHGEFKVTGILRDLPTNTSLQIDFLHSTVGDSYIQDKWTRWEDVQNRMFVTYILLHPNAKSADLERKLPDLINRYIGPQVRATTTYHLQSLNRVHLYSNVDYAIETEENIRQAIVNRGHGIQGDIRQVYMFACAGVAVLAIACINFMSLSTARSTNRAREVGMRKVVGAHRQQLIHQFLNESILIAFFALPLAVMIGKAALPFLNTFLNRDLNLNILNDWTLLLGLIAVTLFVGLLSGSYPALFLSKFHPIEVLKGTGKMRGRETSLRKGLVVIQFAISILLIVATIMVSRQLVYIKTKKLGFNKEHIVVLPIFITHRGARTDPNERLASRYNVVKQVFLEHPNVLKATAYNFPFGMGTNRLRLIRAEGIQDREIHMAFQQADEDYLDTFEIELLSGRNFSTEMSSDFTEAILLNESAVKYLGWKKSLDKQIEVVFLPRKGRVIGIIKNYHHQSLRETIGPMGIYMRTGFYSYLALKIQSKNILKTIEFLDKTWQRFVPNRPFTFWFMDDQLNTMYQKEVRLGQVLHAFTILAIFIACLGLFALSAYTAEQRTKEIGIRKVLGATVLNIVLLLSKDFVKLILIANLIVWPVAYYAAQRWLENFAYRIDFGIGVFLLSGVLMLMIALCTVSYQAIRVAVSNPVDTLRDE